MQFSPPDVGMNSKIALQQAVESTGRSWPQLYSRGDPNTIDIFWHARKVANVLRVQLPVELPKKELGVSVVEKVERYFVSGGTLVRQVPAADLSEKALRLVDSVRNERLLLLAEHESYIAALYSWHGCINMAKLLRAKFVVPGGEESYAVDDRIQGYELLRRQWCEEDIKGNPWVRYGVSLARLLEKNRKGEQFSQKIIEDWVPQDSPYWD